jgi:hypothetical protein
LPADNDDITGGLENKKHPYRIRRTHETIDRWTDTYEVDSSDNDDEVLTKTPVENVRPNWVRVGLGISLAVNLIFSIEFVKRVYGLPYGDAIQLVEAIAALGLLVGGVVWSRRG